MPDDEEYLSVMILSLSFRLSIHKTSVSRKLYHSENTKDTQTLFPKVIMEDKLAYVFDIS